MFSQFAVLLMVLAIVVPGIVFYKGERKAKSFKKMLTVNISAFFGIFLIASVIMFTKTAFAETTEVAGAVAASSNGMAFLGAALSTGLGSLGAGIATGSAASAALGALSENDSIMGKALIFVGLAEGIAIYGFVISFLILNNVK